MHLAVYNHEVPQTEQDILHMFSRRNTAEFPPDPSTICCKQNAAIPQHELLDNFRMWELTLFGYMKKLNLTYTRSQNPVTYPVEEGHIHALESGSAPFDICAIAVPGRPGEAGHSQNELIPVFYKHSNTHKSLACGIWYNSISLPNQEAWTTRGLAHSALVLLPFAKPNAQNRGTIQYNYRDGFISEISPIVNNAVLNPGVLLDLQRVHISNIFHRIGPPQLYQ